MFQGSFVALVTPFTEQNQVDYFALARLIHWHLNSGTAGIVILGTTGESPTITESEAQTIIQKTLNLVQGRIPVIVGTGTNNTQTTVDRTQKAYELGADGCLQVVPYYNKPTQSGLLAHFQAAAEIPIAQILYQVPSRTGCRLSLDSILTLSQRPHIVALKDATGDMHELHELKKQGCSLDLLSGDDPSAKAFLESGGDGMISVTANILPKDVACFYQLIKQRNLSQVQIIHQRLMALNSVLFLETNPIAVKWALAYLGLIHGHLRLPLTRLDRHYQKQLQMVLEQEQIKENI